MAPLLSGRKRTQIGTVPPKQKRVVVPWLALAPNIQLETVLLILLGVTTGAYFAPTVPLLAEATAGDSPANGCYGTTYGLSNTAYSLDLVAGPLAGTLIAQRWGLFTAILSYSVLLLLVAAGAAKFGDTLLNSR